MLTAAYSSLIPEQPVSIKSPPAQSIHNRFSFNHSNMVVLNNNMVVLNSNMVVLVILSLNTTSSMLVTTFQSSAFILDCIVNTMACNRSAAVNCSSPSPARPPMFPGLEPAVASTAAAPDLRVSPVDAPAKLLLGLLIRPAKELVEFIPVRVRVPIMW